MDLRRAVHVTSQVFLVASLAIALAAWIAPMEVVQNAARRTAGAEPLAQFEAGGAATAVLWSLRIVSLLSGVACVCAVRVSRRMARFLSGCARGFAEVTGHGSPRRRMAALTWRLMIIAWTVLAVSHAGSAISRHTHDWPIYRWRLGGDLLPNISDSNRDLIRYLAVATPEDARILVVSNQKLFFLSYYLLPREIYHRTHPDAEFVIPQPNQQRPLPAYQLEDRADVIAELRPDYVLEYWEGPGADPQRFTADPDWLAFMRQLKGDPMYIPPYEVRLMHMNEGLPRR